jgi:hypothetical protein
MSPSEEVKMKNLALGLMTLSLISCAHQSTPEKYVALPFASELLENIQKITGRQPASIEFEVSEEKSPRRVYFSSLYHQYLTLGQLLKVESLITSCPAFHHDKVETDGFTTPEIAKSKITKVSQSEKPYFPELAFNKKFSLKDHHESIREELNILCDEGVSDNYFKFDNLVTHYANKKSFHMKPEAMASVLKIPVFANYYLVKMLQKQEIGFQFNHPDEKRFIKMTNTSWFETYVSEASKYRNSLLKTKMVKR